VSTGRSTGRGAADRPRGRPRSDQAHRAILEATRDLLTSDGYDRLSMDAIAARAGVGKQTVYRWWPSKAAVVAEAVIAGSLSAQADPPADTGDVLADLRAWMRSVATWYTDPRAAGMIRGLAAAAADREFDARRLYAGITGPTRDVLRSRMAGGVEAAQLRADADLDAAADALIGYLLYQVLSRAGHTSEDSADGLVDILINGLRAR
jgi:AcrR family transcriptional regulator